MHLRFTQTQATILAGSVLNYDWLRGALYTGGIFGGASTAFYVFEASQGMRTYLNAVLIGLGSGVAFAAFILLLARFLSFPLQVKRTVRQNPKLFGAVTLDVSEDGIAYTTQASSAKFDWTDMRGFKEGREVIDLCVSKTVVYVVPKPDLTPLEIETLLALLERHLKRLK